MKDIMRIAVDAAMEAGELLRQHFGKALDVEKKIDHSLVTNIDKASENIIVSKITSAFSGHGIIGEESGCINSGEYTWVIDPIDGTHNYIRGMELFGVSIGVLRKNEFVAGVIYLPSDNTLYSAEIGSGAYKNDVQIHVSKVKKMVDSTLIFDSGFKNGYEEKIETIRKIAPEMFNVRMFGASVRNLTYLAEGKAELVIEFDDKPWDYAAGVTIVKEAGGMVTDHLGNDFKVFGSQYIASNGFIHNEVIKALNVK
jgi:myo-inositol-1(or 4)-monophosphatase